MTQTIKEWMKSEYDQTKIEDIVKHGCSGGIGGLIYYSETIAFHDLHDEEIWDMLYDDAESEGITIMELIASFGGQKDVGSMNQLKNLLCWYAVEREARAIVDEEITP
jgi:hypothetical protein